jgi:uncharacterized protein (TIGR02058 family)
MQIGMGADLHGANDTKAALRAVNDAIQNNNMLFLRHVGIESLDQLIVDVIIASPHPEQVDKGAVAGEFPVGTVAVSTQTGGMLADSDVSSDPVLIAVASVTVGIKEKTPNN